MRRIAANIIIKDATTRLINHVIELENGVIVNDYPLQVEREAVEWIGGMIVCPPSNKIDNFTNLRISEFIDNFFHSALIGMTASQGGVSVWASAI